MRLTARHADDEDMNNEMRQEERWNDPAAAFLTVSPDPFFRRSHFAEEENIESHRPAEAKIQQGTNPNEPIRYPARLQMGWCRSVFSSVCCPLVD